MKFTRNFKSRRMSFVCAAMATFVSLSAGAQVGGNVEASQIINFSSEEGLKAGDATKILSKRLELNAANDELRSAYVERPGDGLQIERFHQYYKGVKVEHGSFTLTSKNGVAAYAFGRFYPTSAVAGITPSMDEATAFGKAKAAVPAEKYAWESGSEPMPTGRLSLIEDFKNGDGDGVLHLAYAFDIYAEQPVARYMVYIDATDGHVLFMDAMLKHIGATGNSLYSGPVAFGAGQIGSTVYMHDSTLGGGVATYNLNNSTNTSAGVIVSSSSTTFPTDPSVDAHWGASVVYNYWKSTHNRNSWNGSGGILRSYVHYSTKYDNAMWNGAAMVYGDGSGYSFGGFPPLTSLDVCGHEIGHGVCQSTAGLVYSRESGAMNEGLSDIWGSVIEAYGDPHETDATPKDPWLIGEELLRTMRSMKNPKQYGQPSTYLGINWVAATNACSPTSTNDQCGVHTNSGVLNYWFYLMCVGGRGQNDLGNTFNVNGIGTVSGAKIVYAAELTLNNTANYNSMRTATIAAASTIFGACSPEAEAVIRAWYAVGVGADFTPCTPQVGFGGVTYPEAEGAGVDGCKASHIVSVPINLVGGTLSGDSAAISVVVVGGNAVQGTDYELVNSKLSFQPGGATVKTIDFLVYDNGAPDGDKYIDITYALNAGSSNASRSIYKDTTRVMIYNDDYVPYAGSDAQRIVLTYSGLTNTATPFFGSAMGAHAQYIYKASELMAAGIRPGVPMTSLAFNVLGKLSTLPYENFTVGLAQTNMNDFSAGVFTGTTTTVFSDTLSTQEGWTPVKFKTPYSWNGVDNLVVEICFTNSSAFGGNDRVQAKTGTYVMAALVSTNSASGCGLTLGTNNLVAARPMLQITQTTVVESAKGSTRTWNMPAKTDAYFYSAANEKVMAAVINPADSLGCVTVQVTDAGNGFRSASNGSKRSLKEFTIQPGVQIGTTSYDAIFYVSSAELAGVDPGKLKIVQSTSVNDANLQPYNTNIVTPNDVTIGPDFIGFRGSFTQFGRFYLTDGTPTLAVGNPQLGKDEMWTGANPFNVAPVLHWNLAKSERVSIQLFDMSGRAVYGSEETLASGVHQLTVNSPASLVPGVYVLQVIRPDGVFTRQMVKQ
jgi:Zn-dependent metalloprotease